MHSDLHGLDASGLLGFMDLLVSWKDCFPLDSPALNQSLSLQVDSIDTFLLPGWRAAIESKSSVAIWMLERVAAQF